MTFGLSSAADELLLVAALAEQGQHIHGLHEAREVVGAGQHAAAEAVGADEAAGEHRLLARLADRLAVRVLVDDRLADDQHAQVLGGAERRENVVGRVAGRETRRGSRGPRRGTGERYWLMSPEEL